VSDADSTLADLDPDSLEGVAARWLAAEQELARGSGNPARSEELARELSDRYDTLIRAATREEQRLAWEAALRHQAQQEMGSEAWADARRLAELLRAEYEASSDDGAAHGTPPAG
jgi:LAS superfamily LD-carboxypeptidase LdcB